MYWTYFDKGKSKEIEKKIDLKHYFLFILYIGRYKAISYKQFFCHTPTKAA